jgi:class I fructose-bisphosphate aldolase
MVEPLVFKPGERGYGADGDPGRITALVRQAVELGADVVKADPTDDLDRYDEVLAVAHPRPLLVRGGSKMPEEDLLERTRQVIELGVAGIVFGRNVIQHPDPAAITRRLMEIVHG